MNRTDVRRRIAGYTYRTLMWGNNHVPPGLRTILGFAFMTGGVFGFLPVLGFWMFPLGVAFVALDFPPARRRIDVWLKDLHRRAAFDGEHQNIHPVSAASNAAETTPEPTPSAEPPASKSPPAN